MNKGNNIFLFYFLEYLKPLIMKEGTGSTFKAITKSKLTNFKIAVPNIELQNKIAFFLQITEKKTQAETLKYIALQSLFKTLLENLMTGKIRVKDLNLNNLQSMEVES